MGKVIVKLKLTNLGDISAKERKLVKTEPRSSEAEALVDTGATGLALKRSVIRALGLRKHETRRISTVAGPALLNRYEPVRVDLLGRYGNFDVTEVPETVPNLLGQIPLEEMDFVVDLKGRRLVPNPEHGGEWILEMYRLAGARRKAAAPRKSRRRS